MPSLSALSTESSGKVLGDDYPALCAIFSNLGFEDLIFILRPLTAMKNVIRNLGLFASFILNRLLSLHLFGFSIKFLKEKPSLEALDLGLVGHELA